MRELNQSELNMISGAGPLDHQPPPMLIPMAKYLGVRLGALFTTIALAMRGCESVPEIDPSAPVTGPLNNSGNAMSGR